MARCKIESQKQLKLVNKARELFWKFGMRRVSIEEICREADVSKMTYYKYYPNKTELVKCILDQIVDESVEAYRAFMDSDIPFREKVEKSIQLKLAQTKNLSNEFFTDLHRSENPEIKEYYEKLSRQSVQMISEDYQNAQKNGDIRENIKIEFIIYFLNKILDIAHDPELLNFYRSPNEMIMELTNFFFYGILPREKDEQ